MYDLLWLIMTTCNPRHFWPLRHLTREMERHEKIHFDKYNLTNTIWKMHFERLLTFRTKTKTKTISETCGIWDTHNNSGNWETEFLKIFVTWQWQWQTKTKTKTKTSETSETPVTTPTIIDSFGKFPPFWHLYWQWILTVDSWDTFQWEPGYDEYSLATLLYSRFFPTTRTLFENFITRPCSK